MGRTQTGLDKTVNGQLPQFTETTKTELISITMHVTARLIALATGVLAVAGLNGCGRPDQPVVAASEAGAAVAVHVARVQAVKLNRTQPVAGTLRPRDYALVAPKITGTVARADFTVGQAVASGETLVTLSANEITARLAQAQSLLDSTVREQTRETGLLAQGVTPAETVRSLDDRRRTAEAAVAEAQTLQNYTRVTAPFAGVITRKLLQVGDLAQPGVPLLEIEGATGLRAEVEVPGSLALPSLGTRLRVHIAGTETTGTLEEISPAADPLTRTRLAKITLPAEATAARSGDFVRVLWHAGETSALTVPAEAISVFGQMERVFVVVASHAQLRLVKTAGLDEAGRLQINAGLEPNETVILAPPASLRDGQSVEVQP